MSETVTRLGLIGRESAHTRATASDLNWMKKRSGVRSQDRHRHHSRDHPVQLELGYQLRLNDGDGHGRPCVAVFPCAPGPTVTGLPTASCSPSVIVGELISIERVVGLRDILVRRCCSPTARRWSRARGPELGLQVAAEVRGCLCAGPAGCSLYCSRLGSSGEACRLARTLRGCCMRCY